MVVLFALASGYVVFTASAVRYLDGYNNAVNKILGREWKFPDSGQTSFLYSFIFLIFTLWFMGIIMLSAKARCHFARQMLDRAMQVPSNNISNQEQAAILRFIDTLEHE